MQIGFIGLGKMGGALARNLIRAGYSTIVYDLSDAAMANTLAVGGASAASPEALASQADVLFTSLPMPQHLTDLLIHRDALLDRMNKGAIVIDVSTIGPDTARTVHDAAAERGVDFLACPLGKGPAQAEAGEQPIYAGGSREVFERVEALLSRISTSVTYVGDVEQAAAFKLISNLILTTNLLVLAEGLRLGEMAGLEPALLHALLAETGADSYQLRLRGPSMLERDFTAKFSVDLALKDVRLGVAMAERFGQWAPFGKLAAEAYGKAQAAGFGQEDCAAACKIFES